MGPRPVGALPMDEAYKRTLERQQYGIVGHHSAVKVCHWTKEQLVAGRGCYKNTFYGIQSHRCVQMTPMAAYCNKTCLYCWRFQGWAEKVEGPFDEPAAIWEGSLAQHRRFLTGLKGDARVPRERWEEAQNPRHVAISLTGEPTFYPRLGEFIGHCHGQGITTFLVTNGTTPEVLARLRDAGQLPIQLYVSVDSPSEEVFRRLGVPTTPRAWDKLLATLRLLPSLGCRKVVRHTVVKGWNMHLVDAFAALDALARPDFVECKAYEYVGPSRERMSWDNVPSREEVRAFAERLAALLGYEVADERSDSRVVLLMRPGATRYLWEDPRSNWLYGEEPLGPVAPGAESRGGNGHGGEELAIPTPTGLSGAALQPHLHVLHEHHGHGQEGAGCACGDAGACGCGGAPGAGNAVLK